MRSTGSSRSAWRRSSPRRRNPLTVGRRYDPRALTERARPGGGRRAACRRPLWRRRYCATGGFGARLAREQGLLLRANPWSTGDGLDFGLARRAAVSAGMDEYYGRALPGDVPEVEFVSASQLYARHALVLDDTGTDLGEAAWHESDIVQRFPGGAAWYVVDAAALGERTPYGTVAELIDVARGLGGDVRPPRSSRFRFRRRRSSFSLRSPLSACAQPSRTRSAGFAWTTRPASSIAMASPSPACTPRVQTRAASSPAATEAASPPRWCSAASPPRPRSADVPCSDVGAPQASWVNAHRRRSPGSGDGPILLTRRSVSPFSIVAPTAGGSTLALLERPAGRRPDEEHEAGTALVAVLVRHRRRILVATGGRRTQETRHGSKSLLSSARQRSAR